MADLEQTLPAPLHSLPLGIIQPRGWLRNQLRIQADGLSGHLDEFWPDVGRSKWIGGEAEGWERGPYWLDGIIPLAFLLNDETLIAKARYWVDYIVAHQHADGWLGQVDDPHVGGGGQKPHRDPWPLFLILKAFAQWQEATGDERIVPVLQRVLRRIDSLLDDDPLQSWAAMRWPELLVGIAWVHERSEPSDREWLEKLAQKAAQQGYDWRSHFADFQYTEKQLRWLQENHVVNHAMALKEPAERQLLGADANEEAQRAQAYIATLDRFHGQVSGVFSGDESLAGLSPSQGTELCAVVEYLFSLERLMGAFGLPEWGDRLEKIAFNALPATFTTDMWAHQYVQQANQAICCFAPDGERVYTNNGPDSNKFGLEPNFGCCTANMHQGWPKFVSHLWMATSDGGLAAVAHAPAEVRTHVNGQPVTIATKTEYPFRSVLKFTVRTDAPTRFPLYLRVPAWAEGATVAVENEPQQKATPGTFHRLERDWPQGETVVTLTLPMTVRLEDARYHDALTVHRGPLIFALQIGEDFQKVGGDLPHADWEVHPTSPWNYGLTADMLDSILVQEQPIGSRAFDPATPPVTLTASARRIPTWNLQDNAAAPPPLSPTTDAPLETVTLIPYGGTHLRISVFPRLNG